MTKKVVTEKIAKEEVLKWLDLRKVKDSKRDDTLVDYLVESFIDGELVLCEDLVLTQKLAFPLEFEKKESINELSWQPRIRFKDVDFRNVKSGDTRGQMNCYAAAATKQPRAIIEALDTCDHSLTQTITTFFM